MINRSMTLLQISHHLNYFLVVAHRQIYVKVMLMMLIVHILLHCLLVNRQKNKNINDFLRHRSDENMIEIYFINESLRFTLSEI